MLVFFACNNGLTNPTSSSEQYHGDGIASRGPGYSTAHSASRQERRACLVRCGEARRSFLHNGRVRQRRTVSGTTRSLLMTYSYTVRATNADEKILARC
ncbi:hypothetical protein BKA93DRAFT_444103 [Sparassis latifolia]